MAECETARERWVDRDDASRTTERPEPGEKRPTSDRRTVIKGMAVAGVALPFLAACGTGSTGSEASGAGGSGGGSGGGPDVIAKTNQVPQGGGIILQDAGVVLTQPDAGDFKAFSDICTHMGCPVSSVSGGTINCNCHGSQYSITDGSVVGGPAPAPLPTKQITVKGTKILLS